LIGAGAEIILKSMQAPLTQIKPSAKGNSDCLQKATLRNWGRAPNPAECRRERKEVPILQGLKRAVRATKPPKENRAVRAG